MTRKDLENNKIVKQLKGQIDDITHRAETEIKGLQKKAKKNKTYSTLRKKVVAAEKQVGKQIDKRHNQLLDVLGVASKDDLKRLTKKINGIARQVKDTVQAAA